jgi:hypothetical protein
VGKIPYVDFVDLNPPLIMYLMVLPVMLGRFLHIDAISSFNIFIWCLTFLSWLGCVALLTVHKDHSESRFFPIIILSISATNFFIGEWGEFGQRDHLFVLAMCPFFLVRWLRWQEQKSNSSISILSGTALAVGMCLRPQAVLIPLCVELYWYLKYRRFVYLKTPEMLATALTCFVYSAHFYFLPVAMKTNFFHRWVPLIASGYGVYDCDYPHLLFVGCLTGLLPVLIAAAISMRWRRTTLSVPLLIWGISAYVSIVLQKKGWFNHFLPMLAPCCMLAAIQLQCFLSDFLCSNNDKKKRCRFLAISCVLILACCFMPWVIFRKLYVYRYLGEDKKVILSQTMPSDSVMVLSDSLPDSYPTLLQTGRQTAGRYFFLFPITMINYVRDKTKSQAEIKLLDAQESAVLAEIDADIRRFRPRLILVQESSDNQRFPALKYFKQKDFFNAAIANYTRVGDCQGQWSKLAIFKLKEDKRCL